MIQWMMSLREVKHLDCCPMTKLKNKKNCFINFGSGINSKEIVIHLSFNLDNVSTITFSLNPISKVLDLILVQFISEQNMDLQFDCIRQKVSFYLNKSHNEWKFGRYYIELELLPCYIGNDNDVKFCPTLSFNKGTITHDTID